MKKIYGMFGVEMRAYGQKLVKFCTHTNRHTDTRGNLSSIAMYGHREHYDGFFLLLIRKNDVLYV